MFSNETGHKIYSRHRGRAIVVNKNPKNVSAADKPKETYGSNFNSVEMLSNGNLDNIKNDIIQKSTNNKTKAEYKITVKKKKKKDSTSVITKIDSKVDSSHKGTNQSGETNYISNVNDRGSSIWMYVFFVAIIGLIGVGGIFYITKMQNRGSSENTSTVSELSSTSDTSHAPKQKKTKKQTKKNAPEDNDVEPVKNKKESADKSKDKVAPKVEKNNNNTKGSKTKKKDKNKKKTVDLKKFDVTAASTFL